MFIINSIAISNDQQYVIGATNTGYLYIWDLQAILLENSSRRQEKSQNTLVYRASNKYQLFNESINQILIVQDNLYCVVGNKLYQILLSTLISPNQVIDLEVSVYTLIQTFQDDIGFIQYNSEFVVAVGSKLYFIDILHDNNVIEQIDILKSINDSIQTLVPIQEAKITSVASIGQNLLAIGSDIGVIGIWSKSSYTLQSILQFKEKNQELSEVNSVLHLENEQQIISLHKDYLVIWNCILGNDIEIHPMKDYYRMCIYDNNIYLTKGKRQIELFNQKNILPTSSDIVLQLTTHENIMIANGSSPFVDIYVDKSYTLTLSCL